MALNSMGSNFGAISPQFAKGWLSESTTAHVFRYHAQDSGKRKVKERALEKGELADPGGGCKQAHPQSSVAPVALDFHKKTYFLSILGPFPPLNHQSRSVPEGRVWEGSKRSAFSTSGLNLHGLWRRPSELFYTGLVWNRKMQNKKRRFLYVLDVAI